jgi:hypothetical protein
MQTYNVDVPICSITITSGLLHTLAGPCNNDEERFIPHLFCLA